MAVAYDAFSNNGGSSGSGTFSWTHTPVGTPKGVLLFLTSDVNVNEVTAVTYGGVALTQVSGGVALDSAGEVGMCCAWFLGSGIPTGAQTVQVTTGANNHWPCAITVTAGSNTETHGVVLLEGDGTLSEQSVSDGSTGVDSLRFAGMFTGLNTPPSAGANSTIITTDDDGLVGSAFVRETTAGQGSRSVGFSSGSSDDRAAVHLAVREATVLAYPDITGTDSSWSSRLGYQNRRRYSTGRGGNFLEYFEPSFSDPETVTADKFRPEYPTVVRRKAWRPEGGLFYTEVPVPADVIEHGWDFGLPQVQRRWRDQRTHMYAPFMVPQSQDPITLSYVTALGELIVEPAYYGLTFGTAKYVGESELNAEGE